MFVASVAAEVFAIFAELPAMIVHITHWLSPADGCRIGGRSPSAVETQGLRRRRRHVTPQILDRWTASHMD